MSTAITLYCYHCLVTIIDATARRYRPLPIPLMFKLLREDISCILKRDPAARSRLEVVTCYPGLHAITLHRLAHRLWRWRLHWPARLVSHLSRFLTGIEIHPGARLGRRVFIDHGLGVVIGETAVVGDDCTIYQGVTLGGTQLYKGEKRHPTLEDHVVVGAGAQILGGFTVGRHARIGSNAVVIRPVPAHATAVGNPARVVQKGTDSAFTAYAVDATAEDPLTNTVRELVEHAARQEERINRLSELLQAQGRPVDNRASE